VEIGSERCGIDHVFVYQPIAQLPGLQPTLSALNHTQSLGPIQYLDQASRGFRHRQQPTR
jgi:hypothetical protein